MGRLDDIEALHITNMRHKLTVGDFDWLIARVRKLETALRNVQASQLQPRIWDIAREALKED